MKTTITSRMKKLALTFLAIAVSACNENEGTAADSPVEPTQQTIAVAPFLPSGAAASGQYALQLLNFSDVVASQIGSKEDWVVMESSRIDMLEEELRNAYFPIDQRTAESDILEIDFEAVQVAFPEADYLLLGNINGFDVIAGRDGASTATLARRVNRFRSQIDMRVVDVHTREWLANSTLVIDEMLPDNNSAESQINDAMQLAAAHITDSLMLALAEEFTVLETAKDPDIGDVVSIDGGTNQGVRAGMRFSVIDQSSIALSSEIEVIESRSDTAIARVVRGTPTASSVVPASPLSSEQPGTTSQRGQLIRLALGGFYSASGNDGSINEEFVAQISSQIKISLQNYGGFSVIEDQSQEAVIEKILQQQFRDDLSRGREPDLPLGTLRGVDYLVFGMLSNAQLEEGGSRTQTLFGREFTSEEPSVVQLGGTIYLVDVVSGEYAAASNVIVDLPLEADDLTNFLTSGLGVAYGNELTAKLLTSIRPLAVLTTVNGSVILNHKNSAGLQVGDRYKVFANGQSVVDPFTNTVLDNVGATQIAEIEISAFDASGWATARVLEGELPESGDLLLPIPAAEDSSSGEANSRQIIF